MVEKIEYWWRHRIAYPFLRLIFHNPRKDSPIDIRTATSILFLRYDRIGDMIVTTPIFRQLKNMNPRLKIGVFASESNAEIIRCNPHVDAVYVLHANWFKLAVEILKARKEKYNIVLNFIFNRTTTGGLLANIISPTGIKIGQGDEKYRFYFNRLLSLSRASHHMVETLTSMIQDVFHIQLNPDQLDYEIIVDETSKKNVSVYLKHHDLSPRQATVAGKLPYIIFNLSANDSERRISQEQAIAIGKLLGSSSVYRTVLLHAPQDASMLQIKQNLVKNSGCLPFPDKGDATLLEIAALMEGALAVCTPDTSIVHFASAAKTPVLGFYTKMQDVHEWLPHKVMNRLVMSSEHEPTSAIPIHIMLQAIIDFLKGLNIVLTNTEQITRPY
jgi:ADP-heptose:LPS heptosyltransferase